MAQYKRETAAEESGQDVRVDAAVRVYPGTSREVTGIVVEDFGDISGQAVDVGEHHIVDAARRWAVQLADGTLAFVDDADVTLID
jgi:hypothetical protein